MPENNIDPEELINEHKEETEGGRTQTEAAVEKESDAVSLEDAVKEAYEQLDDGELPENLTIRDEHLAALFAGLGETGQLEDVGEAAADALDRDADGLDARATVLRLLVRVALDEVAPEMIESAKEGRREFLASQADEF